MNKRSQKPHSGHPGESGGGSTLNSGQNSIGAGAQHGSGTSNSTKPVKRATGTNDDLGDDTGTVGQQQMQQDQGGQGTSAGAGQSG
jgi:hypothetical protein